MKSLKNNTPVEVTMADGSVQTGTICGFAITEQPIIGRGYIVKWNTRPKGYEYDCGLVFEHSIRIKEY